MADRTEEHKAAISAAMAGKPKTEAQKAAISAALKASHAARKAAKEDQPLEVPEEPVTRYNQEDMSLLLSIFLIDQRLEIPDLITVAQARYYMSIRPDNSIPPVMRTQIERLCRKYKVAHD